MFVDIRKQNVIFTLITEKSLKESVVRKLLASFNEINEEIYPDPTYFGTMGGLERNPKGPQIIEKIREIESVDLPLSGGVLNFWLTGEKNTLRPVFGADFGGLGFDLNKIGFSFPYNDIVNNLVKIGNLLEPVFTEAANQSDLLTGYVGFNSNSGGSGFSMSDYEFNLNMPFDWIAQENRNKYLRGVYWLNYIKEDLWKKVEKNLEGEDCEVKKVGEGYVLKISNDLESFTDDKRRHFEGLMAEILPKGIPPYDDEDIPGMLEQMRQSGK